MFLNTTWWLRSWTHQIIKCSVKGVIFDSSVASRRWNLTKEKTQVFICCFFMRLDESQSFDLMTFTFRCWFSSSLSKFGHVTVPKLKNWERNGRPSAVFFSPSFPPPAFPVLAFVCCFSSLFSKPWGACRCHCLDSPLRRVQSEAFSHNEITGGNELISLYISSRDVFPRWWQLKGFFLLDPTPKKLGEDSNLYFDLQKYVFQKWVEWNQPSSEKWQFFFCTFENDRETWEVLRTTSTSLTNFEDFWKRRCQPVLPCS